jgi:DNA (cytosine-5)-methyltransferase 1
MTTSADLGGPPRRQRVKAGTLFSGIGAPEVACPEIDWRWCAEIDAFASAVHRARFPDVPNLGDVTEIDPDAVEPVDLVVAGPPCQDHSVAGKRAGLAGSRGNLSLEYVDILDAIDPLWSLTENVPGWLSLADNAFGAFLGRLVGATAPLVPSRGQRWTDAGVVDGPRRTAAWRILDAQYFGVPQRRRRVFVLAIRGAGNWAAAEALFPQRQGLRGDIAPRRQAGEGVARPLASCVDGSSGYRNDADTIENLIADVAPSLTVGAHDCTGHQYRQRGNEDALIVGSFNNTGQGWWNDADIATGLRDASAGSGPKEATLIVHVADPISAHEARTYTHEGRNNFRLRNVVPAIAFQSNYSNQAIKGDRPTLTANRATAVASAMAVRRLTPVECEKLQGFPPGWTAVQYRGKPAADGNRYRALGNSMAVPVIRWILDRIRSFDED